MLAYVDCFSGISGDMLLGALLDAGVSLPVLQHGLSQVALSGYALTAERITEHGISGTRVHVAVDGGDVQAHRTLADIEGILETAGLPQQTREWALRIFRRLGEVEARIHNVPIAEVAFHEVGAVDSIVDIVGATLCLETLAVHDLYCSELPLTFGRVRSAHGELPVPAPATLALIQGTDAVWTPVQATGELVTPTGAAIVATLARFERPAMKVRAIGYGFGTKQLPWANYLRVIIGERPAAPMENADAWERDEVVIVESNIDNMTGEALGWLSERLFAAGALDVTYAPMQMKKNRPGALLSVIADPPRAESRASLILRESGTLGVRMRTERRMKAARREERFESSLGAVRVKLKVIGGRVATVAPEYEDCKALAERSGLPLEEVRERVAEEARGHFRDDGSASPAKEGDSNRPDRG